MSDEYRLFGIESSPYTVKVRAVLRYRRIPHRWICRFPQMLDETQHVRPAVMPVVREPGGRYRSDSTPIILDLERDRVDGPSVLPKDRAHAFLARLIEDMADEWVTKCLFHYRFTGETDGWFAARWVMSDARSDLDRESLPEAVRQFRERQISRMPRVGCTPENAPLIEESYLRLLDIMEGFVGNERFLFGSRPSLADFGLYAQLKTLATDPTALGLMRARAPFTEHWVRRLDDASGVEGHWSADPDPAVGALLQMAGDTYLPFLAANARALERGDDEVQVEILGRDYRQPPFGYQGKCLAWLREAFRELSSAEAAVIRPQLEVSGCAPYFSEG
jgi:glutathione S-transferase